MKEVDKERIAQIDALMEDGKWRSHRAIVLGAKVFPGDVPDWMVSHAWDDRIVSKKSGKYRYYRMQPYIPPPPPPPGLKEVVGADGGRRWVLDLPKWEPTPMEPEEPETELKQNG